MIRTCLAGRQINTRMTRTIKLIVFFLLLIGVDQFSKYLIRLRPSADGGFYICNKGIAWGIEIPDIFIWIFWVILIFFIFLALTKKNAIFKPLYVVFILSGALSNLIDRIHLGCVIDFIDFKIWPVFNLADVFIAAGTVLFLADYLKIWYYKTKPQNKND